MCLSFSADSPHMNMENRSTWPPYPGEAVAAEPMADVCEQPPDSRQKLWERAHRLYAIGELNTAAQLFTRLAESSYTSHEELEVEAAHG
jgi:hypothetical protein